MRKLVLLLVAMFVMVGTSAFATGLDLSTVTVDTSPVFAMALIVITALAAIWAVKKVIRLSNRS